MDRLTTEHRSWNMSRIKGKNTRPEILMRSLLHKSGFRFRLQAKNLPGKPDMILPKFKAAIFVHGCFWHRHEDCKYAYTPKSKVEFWNTKFRQNTERDSRQLQALVEMGWLPIVVWECEIKKNSAAVVQKVARLLHKRLPKLKEAA